MPNWQPIWEDTYTRSGYPTSANPAGGSNLGSPDMLGSGSYTDVQGGVWVIPSAGVLQGTNDSVDANNFQRDALLLPSSADYTRTSQRIVFTTIPYGSNSGNVSWGCCLKYQSKLIYYGVFIAGGTFQIWRMNNGSNTRLQNVTITGFDTTLPYVVDIAITGTTTATFDGTVKQAGVTKATISAATDGTTPAALQGGGQMGLIPFSNTGLVQDYASSIYYFDAGSALAAGAISQTSISSSSVSLSAQAASGGTAPYTYQWSKSTTGPNGTFANIGGATSLSVTDSPAAGVLTCYRNKATDSAGSPANANSNAFAVMLPDTPLPTINLGFIGDSITGYTNSGAYPYSPAQLTLKMIQGIGGHKHLVNMASAVDQSVSGTKTADWVSGGTYLPGAKTAFAAQSVTHVQVMLGTNDANVAVSAATYLSNLTSLVNDLTGAGYKVILHYPPWRDVLAGSAIALDTINGLLYSYQAQIDSLVNGTTILAGDKNAYIYFSQHLDEFNSGGVHPNQSGEVSYARMWSQADAVALGIAATGAVAFIEG